MPIFKCKMCGGDLEVKDGASVAECQYCGTKQTLPKLGDDERANLYDRANHFRRNNEYDKAAGIYERILDEDKTDAEAYWSLVLCKYGIEYVEDPTTHKRVPTVNRAQYTSVLADEDYKSALEYADSSQKVIYETEARAIDEIQKGILEISSKEEPFDIFICYKETGSDGRRTPDSVLATELYHELTKEGFKVFFSRITLEDKLGTAYEPYIFAALNSAKVMVVVGTKPEYFNAPWVKNEWLRYLTLIKQGKKKALIPAYRDMDPYDLPKEFSHLQAQDMSKLGFMQDLIHGIKKIAADESKTAAARETVVINGGKTDIAPLLKRAFMFLEDSDYSSADEYCEKVLDTDPENAEAYVGKLMAELGVRKRELLKNCAEPFDDKNNYQKAVRFGSDELKSELKADIDFINNRNETAELTEIYNTALDIMQSAKTESEYNEVAGLFKCIPEFKDSGEKLKLCLENAEIARKEAIYASALKNQDVGRESYLKNAIELFESIREYKDSEERIRACRSRIEEIERMEEERRIEKERNTKKRIKATAIISLGFIACLVFIVVLMTVIIPNNNYKKAVELVESGNIIEGYDALTALNNYKDSKEKADEIYFQYKMEKLKAANIGDTVCFGNNDLVWFVLDKEDDKVLLLTKDLTEERAYNTENTPITWENCTLRSYLNNDWYNSTFTDSEKSVILTTDVVNPDNSEYGTEGGNDTQDKIFLLSIDEFNKYFTSDSAIVSYRVESFWLRSPGEYWLSNTFSWVYSATIVFYIYINRLDMDMDSRQDVSYEDGVRPAMWVDVS